MGHGDRYVRNPTLVRALTKHKVVAVAAGEEHSVAVVDDGSVFTWGMGQDGQVGGRGGGEGRGWEGGGLQPVFFERGVAAD